ncbi:MAG: 3-hydroxyacyl-ACP dehydratase FabZ [Deltaproteobacteria bacterium]|nr:3-hydroxyacyl-ACP dehydratase FabZ [Deltaproteobacteria bacterium]
MMGAAQIQAIVPHRFPFLFVDRIVEIDEGTSIVAEHLVSMSSPLLQGHFPGNPIVPGVVQVEAMAQASLVLAHASGVFDPAAHHCFFLGIDKAKFRAPAVPGEVLRIEVTAERLGALGRYRGTVRGGDEVKSTATFTAVIKPKG